MPLLRRTTRVLTKQLVTLTSPNSKALALKCILKEPRCKLRKFKLLEFKMLVLQVHKLKTRKKDWTRALPYFREVKTSPFSRDRMKATQEQSTRLGSPEVRKLLLSSQAWCIAEGWSSNATLKCKRCPALTPNPSIKRGHQNRPCRETSSLNRLSITPTPNSPLQQCRSQNSYSRNPIRWASAITSTSKGAWTKTSKPSKI